MPMTCDDFRAVALTPPLDEAARAHADACPACGAFAQQVARNERLLRRVVSPVLPAGMWERLEQRLPARRRPLASGRASSLVRTWASLVAAAALVICTLTSVLWRTSAPERRLSVVVVEARQPQSDVDQTYLTDYASLGSAESIALVSPEEGD